MNSNMKFRLANRGVGEFKAEAGVIWLYDVIASDDEDASWGGGVSPRQFISALKGTSGPVTVRVNSPGGSVFGAQAMIAAMREHPEPITVQIDSLAASAASVIAAAAAHVRMAPGSMMMIHKAWGFIIGNADDGRAYTALLDKIDGQIAASYAAKSGGDADEYLALMAAETWFTADDALSSGLADEVIEENTQKPKAAWDLSAYANAPAMPELAAEKPEHEPDPEAVEPDLRASRERQLAARLVANEI